MGLKGKKAYNNGVNIIFLLEDEPIPEGFVKGGLSSRTHEQYVAAGKKSAETQRKSWSAKTIQEKEDWAQFCRAAQLNMSEDKKKLKIEKMVSTVEAFPEEKKKRLNKMRQESCKRYWQNLSESDKLTKVKIQMDKTTSTCLAKYGVPFPCMTEQARMHGNDSIPNRRFAELLDLNDIKYTREFCLDRYSFDFIVGNNLLEINPTITHNSTFDPFGGTPLAKDYHVNKYKVARNNNYRCICVWDWDNEEKIINLLLPRERVYGRDCIIKEVSTIDSARFLNTYHLQGNAKSSIRLGLYYNNQLVSLMTFGKPRYNKNYDYELIRLCSSYYVIGGEEKLFKYFVDTYHPSSVISYCDNSKFSGEVYIKLGFNLKSYGSPSKHWYNMKTKKHITDNLLRQRGFDQLFGTNYGKGTSNEQLMLENGFVEIYDCGQSVYEYIKE